MIKTLFAILGGDSRSVMLYHLLKQDGHAVTVYGLEKSELGEECAPTLAAAIAEAPYVIGPVPCSKDGLHLRMPLSAKIVLCSELFEQLNGKSFIAGALGTLKQYPCSGELFDVLARPEMAIKNAIPTAEGAIMLAMENSLITLHDSRCMVLGFGRIAKVLCHHLQALGAHVSMAARNPEDLTWAGLYGYTPYSVYAMEEGLKQAEFIFNTVPKVLLKQQELELLKPSCLIVDLASVPFGIDYEAAKALQLQAICAQSLPGKVAPATAAAYIRDAVYQIAGA